MTKAHSRSIESAESISALSSVANDGSPWAFVSNAASLSGVFGRCDSEAVARAGMPTNRVQLPNWVGDLGDRLADRAEHRVGDRELPNRVSLTVQPINSCLREVPHEHVRLIRRIDLRQVHIQTQHCLKAALELCCQY